MSLRVVICEDSRGYAALVSGWIAGEPDLELAGVAYTAPEAIELVSQTQPDVVVIDRLSAGNDTEGLVKEIRRVCPDVRIALLSGMPPEVLRERAQALRADSYCMKDATPDGPLRAIRSAAGVG